MKLHLRWTRAVGSHYVGIYHRCHVQHYIIISRILVVRVHEPVGRALVYLHVAHPHGAVDAQLGVEEVGPRMRVVQSRVDYFHRSSVGGAQFVKRQYAVLPYIVQ